MLCRTCYIHHRTAIRSVTLHFFSKTCKLHFFSYPWLYKQCSSPPRDSLTHIRVPFLPSQTVDIVKFAELRRLLPSELLHVANQKLLPTWKTWTAAKASRTKMAIGQVHALQYASTMEKWTLPVWTSSSVISSEARLDLSLYQIHECKIDCKTAWKLKKKFIKNCQSIWYILYLIAFHWDLRLCFLWFLIP